MTEITDDLRLRAGCGTGERTPARFHHLTAPGAGPAPSGPQASRGLPAALRLLPTSQALAALWARGHILSCNGAGEASGH